MTATTAGWGFGKSGSGSGDGRGHRVLQVLGAWYERSSAATGRGYDAWYDPVAGELIAAVLGHADVDEELVRLGAARAHAGYGRTESLDDLAALGDALPTGVRDAVVVPEAERAFVAGFESVGPGSFPRARIFGDADDLRTRLADLYGWESPLTPADTHALLAVSIEGDEPPGSAVHATGQLVAEHFGTAERVAWLGGGRFAVIVRRHPGLAVGIAAFESALKDHSAVETFETRLGLEALPATRAGLARLVQDLVDGIRPAAQTNGERLALTLVDTPLTIDGADRSTPWERRRRRLANAWAGGLSLVIASLAAVLVAVGIAQIVGPAGSRFDATTSTLFGPAIQLVPPEPAPSTPGVALAPLSEARGAAAGERIGEPPPPAVAVETVAAVEPVGEAEPAPPLPEAPQVAPAPEPVPEPEPTPSIPQPPEAQSMECSDHPVFCEHPAVGGDDRGSQDRGANGDDDDDGDDEDDDDRRGRVKPGRDDN